MTRAEIDRLCAALPGATAADLSAGELDSWKVGGKMFACFAGSDGQRPEDTGVSLKTAGVEVAQMLVDAGVGARAPYFHRSWIRIDYATLDPGEVAARVRASYDVVRGGLTAAQKRALDAG
jgi:predicted DNA-binding protein (MmcQ/YjbR family)